MSVYPKGTHVHCDHLPMLQENYHDIIFVFLMPITISNVIQPIITNSQMRDVIRTRTHFKEPQTTSIVQ